MDPGAQPLIIIIFLPSFLFFLFSLVFWTDEAQKDKECLEEEEGRRKKKKEEEEEEEEEEFKFYLNWRKHTRPRSVHEEE